MLIRLVCGYFLHLFLLPAWSLLSAASFDCRPWGKFLPANWHQGATQTPKWPESSLNPLGWIDWWLMHDSGWQLQICQALLGGLQLFLILAVSTVSYYRTLSPEAVWGPLQPPMAFQSQFHRAPPGQMDIMGWRIRGLANWRKQCSAMSELRPSRVRLGTHQNPWPHWAYSNISLVRTGGYHEWTPGFLLLCSLWAAAESLCNIAIFHQYVSRRWKVMEGDGRCLSPNGWSNPQLYPGCLLQLHPQPVCTSEQATYQVSIFRKSPDISSKKKCKIYAQRNKRTGWDNFCALRIRAGQVLVQPLICKSDESLSVVKS